MIIRIFSIVFCFILFPGFRLVAQNDSIQVYVLLSETCPICKSSTSTLNALVREMQGKPVRFEGYFPSALSNDHSRKTFGKKYKIVFPLYSDSLLNVTERFNATITPEVIVYRPSDGTILYRGLIDNSYLSIGKRRQVVNEHYLSDALLNYFEGGTTPVSFTQPVGCFIRKPQP